MFIRNFLKYLFERVKIMVLLEEDCKIPEHATDFSKTRSEPHNIGKGRPSFF